MEWSYPKTHNLVCVTITLKTFTEMVIVIIIGQNTQLAWILEVCTSWAWQAMALSFIDKKLIVDQIV